MPDAYGNFKGMAVNAAAWERIFGRGPCGECVTRGRKAACSPLCHPNSDNPTSDR